MFLLVTLFTIGLFAAYRLRWGYPQLARDFQVIGRGDAAFLEAAAETFFPADAGMPLSGAEADLPGYADDYLLVLPVKQRRLIRALFLLFEQGTLLWPARGVGAFRRFSALSPEQRLRVLRNWEHSRLASRRMAFSALKAVLILGYMGRPESLAELGMSPWSIESPIVEADRIYPPIGEGMDRIPYTREDLTPPSDGIPLRGAGGGRT
ncbi:MAG: hypothetical protein VCC04_16035 [Myxococcota bacterium]